MPDQAYINALKIEREHYVRTGRKDRVAMVDAELKKAGAASAPVETSEPVVETAAVQAPETTSRPRAARKAAK